MAHGKYTVRQVSLTLPGHGQSRPNDHTSSRFRLGRHHDADDGLHPNYEDYVYRLEIGASPPRLFRPRAGSRNVDIKTLSLAIGAVVLCPVFLFLCSFLVSLFFFLFASLLGDCKKRRISLIFPTIKNNCTGRRSGRFQSLALALVVFGLRRKFELAFVFALRRCEK